MNAHRFTDNFPLNNGRARLNLWLAAALVVVALTIPGPATAQVGPARVLPPAACPAACGRGQYLFERHQYARAAESWQAANKALPAGPATWRTRVDLTILTARAWELAGQPGRAGMAYLKAGRVDDTLGAYLAFKSAATLVQSDHPPPELLKQQLERAQRERDFAGSALVAARVDATLGDGLPSVEHADRALGGSAREPTCRWLSGQLAGQAHPGDHKTLRGLLYGRCLPDELADGFDASATTPPALMRLERAQRWYGAVRFQQAFAELGRLDVDALAPTARCRAQFRRARTLYRLRKRSAAIKTYKKVARACHDPANQDQRVRALYAVGKMLYRRDKYTRSTVYFERLLSDYPARSHADDALLYLARIARHQHDKAAETRRVARALADYPHGDMVHEIAWEYSEDDYRSGRFGAFLDKLDSLDLPDFDAQYFSQGRLAYFRGQAALHLGQHERAGDAWQRAWRLYPFSFYGYLARQRLLEAGMTPDTLEAQPGSDAADWFVGDGWPSSAGARLARLGLYGMAADVDAARLKRAEAPGDAARWRLAYLEHLAGRFSVSHNIARRSISGRPWAMPAAGRRVRWSVAWPNPFGRQIHRAIVAERRQADHGQSVQPALPAAIMREESSFIEDIESWAGALGLMQLMPATAGDHDDDIDGPADPAKLKHASNNIRVGVDLLFALARRFHSHPVLMTAAYNAGGGAVSGWIRRAKTDEIGLWVEDIPYDQTRNYTKRVIGSYAAYQWLGGLRQLDPAVAADP